MAALLYIGEYVHARHTWRRWKDSNPPSYLVDWWKVGAAMAALSFGSDSSNLMELTTTIWNGLEHIQNTHPSPISGYAVEVGVAFRKRILRMTSKHPPPQPYWSLLNFSSTADYEQFFRSFCPDPSSFSQVGTRIDAKTSLTQVVAFLDSRPPSVGNTVAS